MLRVVYHLYTKLDGQFARHHCFERLLETALAPPTQTYLTIFLVLS